MAEAAAPHRIAGRRPGDEKHDEPATDGKPLIGVLALQGSVEEHIDVLHKLGAATREIRVKEEVAGVDGLIFPGGESTAMAIMTEGDGLFPALREAVGNGVPAYGTCAGLILLADDCVGQKAGGQALVGGLDCTVCRNYFGAQVSSFELPLEGFPDAAPAVFIRAPAILKRGPTCEALASVTSAPSRDAAPHVEAFEPAKKKRKGASSGEREVCVAARQGHILATSFHPELTSDSRWHAMFLDMVRERKKE
jgi:5'-phosphate synthase pdxT subunit